MSACDDCTRAAAEVWHGFAARCPGCSARALARAFLAKGERGRRLALGCETLGVTSEQVSQAWAVDACNQERQS